MPTYESCLSRLQKLCSKAEYCSTDVYRKALKALDGDAQSASRVVDALTTERYVDDARYALAFAREKALLQGWGPMKIRFQLRSKGIADAHIDAALTEVEPEKAADKLLKVMAAKSRSLQGDPQYRLKMLKFGLSRGYDYEAVEAAIRDLNQ